MCYQYDTKEINIFLSGADLPEVPEFEVDEIRVPDMGEYIHTCSDGTVLIEEGEMI